MKKLSILILLTLVVPAWAGLGDLGKLKKLTDKKEDKAQKKEDSKKESKANDSAEPAEPTQPINKPEDVDKGGKIKTPWHGAKVGQSVKSKMMGNTAMQMEVVEVKDRVLLMKATTFQKGKPISKILMYYPKYVKKQKEAEKDKTSDVKTTALPDETLTISGKKIKCKVQKTEMKQDGKTITSISWTSEEIPGQTAKIKSDSMGQMQVISEVVEFKK